MLLKQTIRLIIKERWMARGILPAKIHLHSFAALAQRRGTPDLKKNVTLKEYLTWAFRFTLALAGFLAVMMIVIGGVEYIISGANESSRSDAKKSINSAICGLVLALVSYLVLYTINPSLVDFENNQFFKEKQKQALKNNL